MSNSNVIFKKGDSSSSSLPSSTTEGTIYFDENNQSILLDTDTANNTNGRKIFSDWSETAKLSSANTFTGINTFNQTIQGDISGNAASAGLADCAIAADLATTPNSLTKFEDTTGTFTESKITETLFNGDAYSYSFGNTYAIGQNSVTFGENSFAFGNNSLAMNSIESFLTSNIWMVENYSHEPDEEIEEGLFWYGPAQNAIDPNFNVGDYIYDFGADNSSNRIKKVIAKTTWEQDQSTPIYGFSNQLEQPDAQNRYSIKKVEYGAFGNYNINIGKNNITNGNYNFAIGEGLIANNDYEIALGKYNSSNSTSPKSLFSIGNGNNILRNNLISVFENGNIIINGKISIAKDQTLSSSPQELFSTIINNKKLTIEAVKYSAGSYSTNPLFKINAIATGSSNDLVLQSKQLFIEIDGQVYKAVITGGTSNPGGIGSTLKFEYVTSNT